MGLLDIFTKKNEEEEKKLRDKISELSETVGRKNKEISDLINEIEKLNQNSGNLNSKQMVLIEKNLKETREESKKLKMFLDRYNLTFTKEKYYYKIDLERFFASTKFKELVDYLIGANIHFVQDISNEILEEMPKDMKNLEEARMKLNKFWSKEFIEWDIVTFLNKGERVTKLYNKSRKFTNILSDEGIEFIEDMVNYNFNDLEDKGFKNKKIEEFIEIRDKYYEERRVSIK